MNSPRSHLPVCSLLLSLSALAFIANISHAAVLYKDAASTDVNNPANWSTTANAPTPDPTSIGTGDQLRFNEMFAPTAGTTYNPNLSSDLAIGSIRSDSGSSAGGTAFGNVSITGTSTLTLNGTGDGSYTTAGLVMNAGTGGTLTIAPSLVLGAPQSWVVSRSLTVNGNLSLGANTLTFYPAGSGTIILSGAIAGTKTAGNNALLLNGASTGIVRLGNPANSFTGNIEFAGGAVNILEFTSAGGLGASPTAEIRFRNTGGTAGAGSILRYIGSADTIISKQIQCDTSIGMRIESDSVGGSLTLNGTWNQTSRPLTLGGSGTGSNTLQQAFTGSGKLTKNGIGNWVLAANNTYSGGTELLGGTLSVGAMNGIGTGYLAVKNGAVFKYTGTGSETRPGQFFFDNGNAIIEVTDTSAALTLWRTSGTHSKPLIKRGSGTLRYGATGDNNGASAQVDAAILEAISSADNNFASVSINNGGTFRLGRTDGTGVALTADHQVWNSGSVTINAGGTWDQNEMAETIGTLNLNGGQIVGSGTLTIQTAINAQAGSAINGTTVTLPSSAALSFQANGTAGTFATISGTGSLTLNANPVTINVAGAALGVGTYTLVNCSGTLANTGTFGVPTITGAGLVSGNVAVVSVSGNSLILTVTAPLATITAPASFSSAVSTTYGSASTPATATVSGTDLTADIIASAPAGLEVSSNGTDYGPTATFVRSGGSVTATPLYVRIKNNAPAGTYDSRNVTLTSVGAQTLNVATTASGNIVSPKALVVENIVAQSKTFDGTTAATVTGSLRTSEDIGEGSSGDGKPYTGDVLTLTCTGSAFADSAIGTGKTVTAGTFALGGSSAGNYTVTQPSNLTLTADIVNTAIWANASGGSWPTAANWENGAVGIGTDNTADFSTRDLSANTIVTLDGPRTIGNLKFGDAGEEPDSNWTINAGTGGTLTLDVKTGNPVVEVTEQAAATISAVVTGNDGLKKTGSGKLVLSAVNTYTGGTIIDGGTLRITASSDATGGIRGTLTANAGTTIEIGGPDVLGYGGSVSEVNLNGATMTQTQNRNETFAGTMNLTGGTVSTTGGANAVFDLFGSAAVTSLPANLSSTISSPIRLRRIDTIFTVADGEAADDLLVSGTIFRNPGEGNGALIKKGSGKMVLSNNNTYDGGTTISEGILQIGNGSAAGEIGSGAVNVAGGASLIFNRTGTLDYKATSKMRNVSGAGTIVIDGGLTFFNYPGTGNGFSEASSWAGFSGNLVVKGGSEFKTIRNGATAMGTGTVTLGDSLTSGSLSQIEGSWTWTTPIKSEGTGNQIINRSGTISGGRKLKIQGPITGSGILSFVDAAGSMGGDDSGFILTGVNTPSALTIDAPVRVGGVPGDNSDFGPGPAGSLGTATVIINSGKTLTLSRTDTHIVAATLRGAGGLKIGVTAVAGTATQVASLENAHSYTGPTTVANGTLLMNGSLAPQSVVTVAAGATLGGTGTIGGVASVNGTLAPGANSIGTLTLGATPVLTGTLAIELDRTAGTADKLALGTNNFSAGGGLVVTQIDAGAFAAGDSFTMISTTGERAGWFNSVTLPQLAVNLSWDTNKLAMSGVLDVYSFTATPIAFKAYGGKPFIVPADKMAQRANSSRGTAAAKTCTIPAHGTATVTDGALTYEAASGYAGQDTFVVTFEDGHGVQRATVNVTVEAVNASPTLVFASVDGHASISTSGMPNTQYRIQIATDVEGVWTDYATVTSEPNGVILWTDTASMAETGTRFYRLAE